MPQIELLLDKGYEILYFTDEVDEFAIQSLGQYKEHSFKSIFNSDLDIEDVSKQEKEEVLEKSKDMIESMKALLKDKISDIVISSRLKNYPVCLSSKGNLSIEMEKTLSSMPTDNNIKAEKILELNDKSKMFENLNNYFEKDVEKFNKLTNVLYNQALLIEGLSIPDPIEFTNNISDLLS